MKRSSWIIIIGFIAFLGLVFIGYAVDSSKNTDEISVAYIPSDHEAALFVALAQNSFSKAGLKVKSVQMSTGSDVISAVASGDIEIGYVGVVPALTGISQGEPIKIVGAVNLDGSGIVVGPNSNLTTIPDLKGKKMASPGVSSIQQVLLLYELQKYNMTANDLDILQVNIFMLPSTLASNKVDAYIAYQPFVSLLPYRNMGKVMMYSDQILKDHPCCVIIARQEFIDNHPDQLQTFLNVHQNATDFVNNNQNETANLISTQITTNPDLEKMSLPHTVFVSRVDKTFQVNVMNFLKIEQELGYMKKNLTEEQIFDARFLG